MLNPWTDSRIVDLTRYWAEGLSCSQIAASLGNTTRNAVIGKIHRLGLPSPPMSRTREKKSRAARERRPVYPRQRFVATPELVEQATLRCVEIIPRGLALVDLEPNDCRWPYGGDDGQPITFCAHPQQAGSSYCTPHYFLACGPGTSSERAATKVKTELLAVG